MHRSRLEVQIEQCHLGVPAPSMNAIVSALRFFFTQTLDRPDLVRMRYERKLPAVLSQDEVARLVVVETFERQCQPRAPPAHALLSGMQAS